MRNHIRVAVIDDHPLFRDGVVHTLQSTADMVVVGQGATAQDAIRIGTSLLPDIMLMDVNMPGSGIDAAREIRCCCPSVKTVMLTVSESEDDVAAAMQIGVSGYILKGSSGAELVQILRSIQKLELYVTPALAARLLGRKRQQAIEIRNLPEDPSLTYREGQVLQLLSQGMTNKEIANGLKLTEKTVKHYMTELMQKLQVRNRVEAVLIARRRNDEVAFLPGVHA
jgi:DNA-binding NarL/FixJ family response regulator